MTAPLSLQGHAIQTLDLRIGNTGPWIADVLLTEAPALSGKVTLTVGDASLSGTIIQAQSFGLALGARVAGGAAGWSNWLQPRGYHNDAGIKALMLAQDAAREVGETLGTFAPAADRVGVDYTRHVATAAAVLEYAAGGMPWWVDYAGVTHVGPRVGGRVPKSAYTLLGYNPRERVAMLAVDNLAELVPGRVIEDERLETSFVIGDIELRSEDGKALRATVWGAETSNTRGRLGELVQSIVQRLTTTKLHGIYKYRVIDTRGDLRVDLQAVRKSSGLPDLQAVPQCPGVPGMAAELTDGTEVLVQFVDGNQAEPIITHYAGPDMSGFAPVGIVLGGATGEPAARQGDSVEVLLPPAMFSGTIGPAPASGVITWTLGPKADGTITGGSSKVRIAT